jgi:Ca2+-binding RTX toxin-like protein
MAHLTLSASFGVDTSVMRWYFPDLSPSSLYFEDYSVTGTSVTVYDNEDPYFGGTDAFGGTFTPVYEEVDGYADLTELHGQVTSISLYWWYDDGEFGDFFRGVFTDVSLDVALFQGPIRSDILDLVFAGDDLIEGTPYGDHLYGFTGNDDIEGKAGDDFLYGQAGTDTLRGGLGNDTYYVDSLDDRANELRDAGTDTVISLSDFVLGLNVEHLTLRGKAAIDGTGNSMANQLTGNIAANRMSGGGGADTLVGGGGADSLFGDAGADTLTGNGGADVFFFRSVADLSTKASLTDTITDFVRGFDKISLRAIDAKASTSTNDAFTFIGNTAFSTTNATGQLRYVYDAATGMGQLQGSTDADSAPEFVIKVQGVQSLSLADLVL